MNPFIVKHVFDEPRRDDVAARQLACENLLRDELHDGLGGVAPTEPVRARSAMLTSFAGTAQNLSCTIAATLALSSQFGKQMLSSLELTSSVPKVHNNRFRIEMTVSCRDCDGIPKVPNAGSVVVENGRTVQIMHNGLRVLASGYCGGWMTEVITRLKGHHEPQEELVFDALLRAVPEHATMIEVGGHWSYYSLWFLQGKLGRRAIVIEPDPNYLEIGRANAQINGSSVDFINGFVGLETDARRPFPTETAGTIDLPQINLSDFISSRNLEPLTILHCDAQGAEVNVIVSCEALLRRGGIEYLALSTHSAAITDDPLTHQRCLEAVRDMGGRVLAEHDVHESFSGDGLVVAHFGKEAKSWPLLALSYNRYSNSLFRNPAYDLCMALNELGRPPGKK